MVAHPHHSSDMPSYWVYMGMSLQVLVMLTALMLSLFWLVSHFINHQNMREVYINLELNDIQRVTINRILATNGDIRETQQAIQELAWIKSAWIRKSQHDWIIQLEENAPIAQLKQGSYIFADGSIMIGDFLVHRPIPQAVGPAEQLSALAPTMSAITHQLHDQQLTMDVFSVTNNGAVIVQLDNDRTLYLGSHQHMERLARFISFITIHDGKSAEWYSMDLRYDNAIAVNWQGS